MSLKVYGGTFDGVNRLIVAAPSKKRAAALLRLTVYLLNNRGGETWNEAECAVCLAAPEVVFRWDKDSKSYVRK